MVKQNNEVSVFFSISDDLLAAFNKAVECKSKELGIVLNKKQAYNLAIKEISEIWTKEKPQSK